MTQILDYSAGYPGAAAIRRAGYAGAIRYLRKEGASVVKPITAAEYTDLRAHGLDVALIYQALTTTRILAGRDAGRHDARWAIARAAEIGVPDPPCIYFACDRDVVGADQLDRVMTYLDGAAEILGRTRVGVYGEFDVIERALPAHAAFGWQTVAWSGGRRSTKAHLFQRLGQLPVGGVSCDVNDVLKPNYGQIPEDPMTITDADAQKIADTLLAQVINLKQVGGGTVPVSLRGVHEYDDLRAQNVGAVLQQVLAGIASLAAQPPADVDEAALAAELAKLGVGGPTANQLRAALVDVLSNTSLTVEGS